jgi:GNAT superfamily N-acetyltransferase
MIEVRKAFPNEAPLLAQFQVAMAQETESLTLDPETVLKGVHAVFSRENPATTGAQYYVATDGKAVVGCALILPEWSDWRNGTVWWIHSVFVKPEFRKKGVFRAIYRHLKAQVTERTDLRGLRLFVDRTNTRAQAVYQNLGMDGNHYQLFEWMKP